MKKAWEILKAVGWALTHMADGEMEYMRAKHTCPHCGKSLTRAFHCGPM